MLVSHSIYCSSYNVNHYRGTRNVEVERVTLRHRGWQALCLVADFSLYLYIHLDCSISSAQVSSLSQFSLVIHNLKQPASCCNVWLRRSRDTATCCSTDNITNCF